MATASIESLVTRAASRHAVGMAKARRALARQRQKIDERFEFDGDGVAAGVRDMLRGTLFEVTERQSGDEFCIKLWRKTATDADGELREIWRHEMRHVERVMAHSGAHGVIVDVVEFVEDDDDFGVIMERAGHPLSILLTRINRSHWLHSLSTPAHRARLWQNVRRIAVGLGIVHAQGLVHGRVDEQVVFSQGAREPDFKLSGFEWSLWLDGENRSSSDKGAASGPERFGEAVSFADDWKGLGQIVSRLLGVVVDPAGTIGPQGGRDMPILSTAETRWLRRVCRPRPHHVLEAHALARACDDIIVEVGRMAGSRDGRCTLLIPRATSLAEAVSEASGEAIAADERPAQLNFVRRDLDAGATLFAPARTGDGLRRLYLVSGQLVYRLRPFVKDGDETWDIAVCYQCTTRTGELPIGGAFDAHPLEVAIDVAATDREADGLNTSVGRAALSWEALGQPAEEKVTDNLVKVRSALHLLEVIGGVVKSLDILPIEILRRRLDDKREVVVRALPGNDRDVLAGAIGIGDTASALKHLFEDEKRDSATRWRLSASSDLGASRERDVSVTYVDREEVDGIEGYCFDVEGIIPEVARLYLRPAQDKGTEQQIKRRMRNIEALDTRLDLVEMLAGPWLQRRTLRHEQGIAEATLKRLDGPKRLALETLWVTAPAFWIVGPPGVGKTTLATAIVETIFREDRAARVLICAQGHDALNHIEEKICALRTDGFLAPDILIVRSMAADENKVKSPRRVDRIADEALLKFQRSSLVANAPAGQRLHVERLAEGCRTGSGQEGEESGVLASLMLEAANIVVTTLNSGDIERMVAAREPYDWVIVEEAGKATGPELAGALALGNRRLLIGDHRQLPPFDADRLGKIFANQTLIEKMLANAQQAVGPLFGEAVLEQLSGVLQDSACKSDVIEAARRWVEPFRSVVEEDEHRAKISQHHSRLSTTLTVQRRMDPAIAEVVSETFYGGELKTDASRADAAIKGNTAFTCSEALTSSPIVVVDFPHVSTTKDPAAIERAKPKWHNPAEIEAVIDVLRQLHPSGFGGRKPTLAVLSPYAAQVAMLDKRLAIAFQNELRHIKSGFDTVREGLGYTGTVDSFQGSEADVVIVSLVRNNPRVGLGALGFLRERRRMNVMLSRARDKLILVGSLLFLEEAVRGVNPDEREHDLSFITRMIKTIRGLTEKERHPGVPQASIIAPTRLKVSL